MTTVITPYNYTTEHRPETVCIIDGTEIIARHTRCFGKGELIEQEAHINALWLAKTQVKLH